MPDTANELKMIITQAGLDEVVAASQAGTDAVLITEVGYGTGQYTATPEQTQLQAEFKRLTTVAGGAVADNIIHCTVQDSTDDAYTVYEVGLYTDKGTLFAVYSQNTPILQKSAMAISMLAIDIAVTDFSADQVIFGDANLLNPPATTSTLGVVELATNDETITGTDATRVVTCASLSARTATTGRTGLIRIATSSEVAAGKDQTKALTPANLLAAFLKAHGDWGMQKLPNGLILQWGQALLASNGNSVIAFPVAFPSKAVFAVAEAKGNFAPTFALSTLKRGNAAFKHNGNGGVASYWMAIGY